MNNHATLPGMADSERALDRWVRAALADTYGAVAEERLPEEWVLLLGVAPHGDTLGEAAP